MSPVVTSQRLTIGDLAPSIELPDADGSSVTIDFSERVATAVVFTSNGCPYALAWHDRIQDLARELAPQGVLLVQIVSNDDELQPLDSAQHMAERVRAGQVVGEFLRDADQDVARAYGATATPDVFLVDRDGVVRYHGAPDADYDDPDQKASWLREAMDDLVADRDVARPSTSPAGCSIKWRVDLLWWAGCPSHGRAAEMMAEVLERMGRQDVRIRPVEITSPAEADERGFVGSPSFHVGGADVFPAPEARPGLTCRTYQREDGRLSPLPSLDQLEERMRAVLVRPWELPGWVDFRQQSAR